MRLLDLIKRYGQDEYDFSIRETQTYEIIEDVARMRSEIGLLFLNDFNETVLRKILKSNGLEFHLSLWRGRMSLSADGIRWQTGKSLPMKNWKIIHICPLNRGNIIPFIFPRKFFRFQSKEKYQSQRQGNTFQSFDRAEWLYCMQRCH